MLELQRVRENPEMVRTAVQQKKDKADVDGILRLDGERRTIGANADRLRNRRNEASKQISELKRSKQDASALMEEMKSVSDEIKAIESREKEIEEQLRQLMLYVPNIPHHTVPRGNSEKDNVVVAQWGEEVAVDFERKDHLQLGAHLDIIDFARGAKISGAGFPVLKGDGARLERALINLFLDMHTTKHGYTEIFPPFLVTAETLEGTGQLPKSREQMYYMPEDDLFCIPTAEPPVTNLHRDEMLTMEMLPIKYCAYSACFRREAGSYGKDTKGYLRVHQFNKVELVKFTTPESSYDELETLRGDAEAILKALGLRYRVLALCDADLSFAAAKCYDLEAWAPAEGKFLEVSSCSNFEDFQARRMNVRFRRAAGEKPQFVHTLNGSGLATARILVALLETYQTPQGTVIVPEVLRPYMGGQQEIVPRV